MRLRYTAQSISDLTDIATYLRARNPDAAQSVRASILNALKLIQDFPDLGRRQDVENVRRLVTRAFGHLIYYVVAAAEDEIVVLSIRHPSRERPHDA